MISNLYSLKALYEDLEKKLTLYTPKYRIFENIANELKKDFDNEISLENNQLNILQPA